MRRKRKSLTPDAPLAPVPSEILDQFVRQGPISHEELEAAVRRFKKAIIERALGGEQHTTRIRLSSQARLHRTSGFPDPLLVSFVERPPLDALRPDQSKPTEDVQMQAC